MFRLVIIVFSADFVGATEVQNDHDLCIGDKCLGTSAALLDSDDQQSLLQAHVNLGSIESDDTSRSQMLASDLRPVKDNKNEIHNFETRATPSCSTELKIRRVFSEPEHPLHHGSEMLRLVFHDALDYNNLQDGAGKPVALAEPYGGVDGCLYSGAYVDENGDFHPDPGHNNGLKDSIRVSTKAQSDFSDISKADLKVAGALAALEEDARGPHVPMTWGRSVPQDCEARAGKYQNNKDTNVGSTQFIHVGPDILSFSHQNLLEVFTKLGLTQTDMVALMGAHSYGSVSQCSKVLNKVEVGNFCDKGNTKPLHSELVGGHKRKRPVGKLDKYGDEITKAGTYGTWIEQTNNFDDGAVWDQTPACFDNRYYQTFSNAEYSWKDGCCGKNGKKSLHDFCWSGRAKDGDDQKSFFINGTERDICDASHPWCRSNWPFDKDMKRDKTTMRNAWDYAFDDYQVDPAGGTYPLSAGRMKPVFRMPPEWGLLDDVVSKSLMQDFAADEAVFFDAFHAAFKKVLDLTPQVDNLHSCIATDCTYDQGNTTFTCAGDANATKELASLTFKADGIACSPPAAGTTCSMVQVIGTRAVIKCGEDESLCCENGCSKPLRAWQHKKRLGGESVQLGSCFDDQARQHPNVGDTAVDRNLAFA